jgi:hypothetical protein
MAYTTDSDKQWLCKGQTSCKAGTQSCGTLRGWPSCRGLEARRLWWLGYSFGAQRVGFL